MFNFLKEKTYHVLRYFGLNSADWTSCSPEVLAKEAFKANVIAYRCIDIRSKSVASVPLKVKVNGEFVENHPLEILLKKPNPRAAGSKFIYALNAYRDITGNAYLESLNAAGKPPAELWLWTPFEMTALAANNGRMAQAYQWQSENYKHIWKYENGYYEHDDGSKLLHWETFDPLNKFIGMSPLQPAGKPIDQHNSSSEWNRRLLKNECRPSGAFMTDGLTAEQQKQAEKAIAEKSGAENAGKPLVLGGKNLSWMQMSLSPKDMDWLQGRNQVAREIAAAFGVPTQVIPIQGDQTFANYEQARLALWEDTVMPIVDDLVGELNMFLSPQFGEGVEIVPDYNSIPALDAKRQQKWSAVQTADWLTPNEKRKETGFDLYDDPAADELYISAGLLPIGFDIMAEEDQKSYYNNLRDFGLTHAQAEAKVNELIQSKK